MDGLLGKIVDSIRHSYMVYLAVIVILFLVVILFMVFSQRDDTFAIKLTKHNAAEYDNQWNQLTDANKQALEATKNMSNEERLAQSVSFTAKQIEVIEESITQAKSQISNSDLPPMQHDAINKFIIEKTAVRDELLLKQEKQKNALAAIATAVKSAESFGESFGDLPVNHMHYKANAPYLIPQTIKVDVSGMDEVTYGLPTHDPTFTYEVAPDLSNLSNVFPQTDLDAYTEGAYVMNIVDSKIKENFIKPAHKTMIHSDPILSGIKNQKDMNTRMRKLEMASMVSRMPQQ